MIAAMSLAGSCTLGGTPDWYKPWRAIGEKGKPVRRMGQVLLGLVLVAAILYAGLCAVVFLFQRSMIYFPRSSPNQYGATAMPLPVGAETVEVSTRPSPGPDALLYFGGNGEDVSQAMPGFSAAFPHHAIYLMHYPGYGASTGSPSEQGILADALAVFDRVHADHPNVLVIGRSLGSGVAVHLASERPVSRLVLVTPFDSLAGVAAYHYPYLPVRWLLRDRFESWRYAPQVTAPTRVIIAGDDEVIPRASTDRLLLHFNSGIASYVVIPGVDHNSISDSPDYLPLLAEPQRN